MITIMTTAESKYPNKLKEYRLKAGLTQKQVADILKMQCEDRLSHWERGQAMPSVQNLFRLTRLYKVRPEDLYSH